MAFKNAVIGILADSDAVCDFQEESNGDICGKDPRELADVDGWFFDIIQTDAGGIAVVRCPDHW